MGEKPVSDEIIEGMSTAPLKPLMSNVELARANDDHDPPDNFTKSKQEHQNSIDHKTNNQDGVPSDPPEDAPKEEQSSESITQQ